MEQTYGSVAGPNDVSVRSASRGNSSSTSSSDASSPLRPHHNKTDDELRAPLLSPQRKQPPPQQDTSIPVRSDSDTNASETMSLTDKLYAYDLTLATLTYQRFGRTRPARIAGEVLCHTGDGYLWVTLGLCCVCCLLF